MENQDILDFANMVFSMEYGSIDFEELYPKAYSRECCHIPIHHTIQESEKLKAVLDVYPFTLHLKNSTLSLNVGYIGTVAVHPKARGKGYMTQLMKRAETDALKRGFDLLLLDGDRYRYRSYGFERAGIKYNFNVRLRHAFRYCIEQYGDKELAIPEYSFEEIDDTSEYIPFLFRMYQNRNVTARTEKDFFACLKSNRAVTFVVIADGKPAGYVNLSRDEKNILEFELEDSAAIPRFIYEFMEGMELYELGISVGADETDKLEWLEVLCDYYNMTASHQMKLLNPEKVLEFLAAWKEKYTSCAIDKDKIKDFWKESAADDMEKLTLLTTCQSFRQTGNKACDIPKNISQEWLPLPFFLPDGDAF